MTTKILRTYISSEVLFINDDGEVETMLQTDPIVIFGGQKFNYEEYLRIVAQSAIQGYQERRPK